MPRRPSTPRRSDRQPGCSRVDDDDRRRRLGGGGVRHPRGRRGRGGPAPPGAWAVRRREPRACRRSARRCRTRASWRSAATTRRSSSGAGPGRDACAAAQRRPVRRGHRCVRQRQVVGPQCRCGERVSSPRRTGHRDVTVGRRRHRRGDGPDDTSRRRSRDRPARGGVHALGCRATAPIPRSAARASSTTAGMPGWRSHCAATSSVRVPSTPGY